MTEDTYSPVPDIDRAEIFTALLRRQALRREARLPLLDIAFLYHQEVEKALWRRYVELHHDRVRAEILAQQRVKFGNGWGYSAGGRWALNILTERALRASYSLP